MFSVVFVSIYRRAESHWKISLVPVTVLLCFFLQLSDFLEVLLLFRCLGRKLAILDLLLCDHVASLNAIIITVSPCRHHDLLVSPCHHCNLIVLFKK